MLRHLAIGVLVACACTGEHIQRDPDAPVAPDPWVAPAAPSRCQQLTGNRAACMRELHCMAGGPVTRCSGRHCTLGGPVACLPCTDWVALYARAPPEFCVLRAAGKRRSACELVFPGDIARCAGLIDDP